MPTLPPWMIWVALASIIIGALTIALSIAYAIGRADERDLHCADLARRDRLFPGGTR